MNNIRVCVSLLAPILCISSAGRADAQPAEDPPRARWQDSQLVLVPRLAVLSLSKTDVRYETESYGDCTDCFVQPEGRSPASLAGGWGADDKSLFALGLDALHQFGGRAPLRLGVGALYVPRTRIGSRGWTGDESKTWRIGSDLSLFVEAEGLLAIAGETRLALRGVGGAFIVLPGGDFENDLEQPCLLGVQSGSGAVEAGNGPCKDGPFLGWTAGGGVGLIVPAGDARMRGDILGQVYRVVLDESTSTADGDQITSRSLRGIRFWLMAGMEF